MLVVLIGSTGLLERKVAGDGDPGRSVSSDSDDLSIWLRQPGKYSLDHIGDRGIGTEISSYSLKRERLAGIKLAKEIDPQVRRLRDSVVNDYVNRVVQRISLHSDAKIPIKAKVAIDDEVNAYTLPGGFIYLNSGLILAMDDEASLAGMVAHEVAHVAARHGAMFLAKAESRAASESVEKFYRDVEREADVLALEYVYAAGYDTTGLTRFFTKVQTYRLATITPDHPSLDERIRRAQLEIATLLPARTEYVVNTSEFNEIKARLRVLTANSHHLRRRHPRD